MSNWYINRLKSMSLAEIPFRLQQFLQKKWESRFIKGKAIKHVELINTTCCLPSVWLGKTIEFNNAIPVFGRDFNFLEKNINWHKDIFSGESFDLQFAKNISIRKHPHLSAKNVWEPNRLQFLPQLATNYKISQNNSYLADFMRIIASWVADNPYLMGINWYSNIEVNIRLINWFIAWEIIEADKLIEQDAAFKQFVEQTWLPVIYQHCKYSHANPSKFSSANNHLISEFSGLYIAAKKWEFKESHKWKNYAKRGLEQEIKKQHSSGINKEEAAEYIQFITDFFLIPYVVGNKTGDDFSLDYKETLKQIFDYIFEFLDVNGNFPQYGDEDDGRVLNLSDDAHFNNFKSLMISAALLFNDAKFLSKGFSQPDIKNQILFGEEGVSQFVRLKHKSSLKPPQSSVLYPDEGHFILRKQNGGKEIYLHFDAAPLGYLSIAAHGHADALSFIMHVNGNPFFVDPGTYSYHVSKEWRNYFVSTLAHNTLCIDGENQANHAADTMWLNHYKCKVLQSSSTPEEDVVCATHNGYKKVRHVRELRFDKVSNRITIKDSITILDGKKHTIVMPFHLHPSVAVKSNNESQFQLSLNETISVTLQLDESLQSETIKGCMEPVLGWYSPSFMIKQPTNVIVGKFATSKNITLISTIQVVDY